MDQTFVGQASTRARRRRLVIFKRKKKLSPLFLSCVHLHTYLYTGIILYIYVVYIYTLPLPAPSAPRVLLRPRANVVGISESSPRFIVKLKLKKKKQWKTYINNVDVSTIILIIFHGIRWVHVSVERNPYRSWCFPPTSRAIFDVRYTLE